MSCPEKFKTSKFTLNSNLPRRSFFSDHCVEDWTFEKYCEYNQDEGDSAANQETLLMWFKGDLTWLSLQDLPQGLKSYIKRLKDNTKVKGGNTSIISRRKIFEDTTTKYSKIVSEKVVKEAEMFSGQLPKNHSKSKKGEEGAATEEETLLEQNENQPIQESAVKTKKNKRKMKSTSDALDELEDEIVEYEKKAMVLTTKEQLSMKKEFLVLKKETLEKYRKGHIINIELDVSSLMSLSNIVIVPKESEQSNIQTSNLKEEAQRVRQAFFQKYLSNVKFNSDTYQSLKEILDKYLPEEFEITDAEWEKVDLDCRIELLQLAKKANVYDRAGIESIVNFLTYSSNHNITLSSESHLESSFVHPIVHPVFKSSVSVPHSCNKSISKQKESDPSRRPDYVSDCHNNREFDFTSLFGELKQLINYDQLDLYRIAYFCQKTSHENNLQMSLGFQTKKDKMRFFVMKEELGVDFFMEVASTSVPLRRSDVRKMLLDLDGFSRLTYLQRNHCVPVENSSSRQHHPIVDMDLLKNLLLQEKKTKK